VTDELDLFRDFRGGVATAEEDARRHARERLVHELERPPAPVARRSRYAALAVLAVAGVAATALFLGAPWSSSPTFLERAEAALTPRPQTILHMKWVVTSSVSDPACAITRGPNEMWIDQEPPYQYRAILDDPPPAGADFRSLACMSGTRREVGGTVDPTCSPTEQVNCTTQDTLEFELPDTLSVSPLQFVLPPDPVTMLREAIRAGKAHHVGKTQLNGRTVERIDLDPLPLGGFDDVMASVCAFPSCAFGHVYVDPETFHPIEMHQAPLLVAPPPEDDVGLVPSVVTGSPVWYDARIDVIDRYLTFEYLPRTEANLALTDIRAQHPDATVTEQ
jgi:hypothetical protein